MKYTLVSKLWPFNKRSLPVMLLTSLFTYIPYLIIFNINIIKYFAKLDEFLFHILIFVWLPITLSFLLSALLNTSEIKRVTKQSYGINSYQRFIAFLIGDLFCVWLLFYEKEPEIAGMASLLYLLIALPIQVIVILSFEFFLYLRRY
jgi:hypothetical protein